MPLFVFECEKCKHLLKHSLEKFIGTLYICVCPACKVSDRFKFIREGNLELDWFAKNLKIKNKRRRGEDRLHRTDTRKGT